MSACSPSDIEQAFECAKRFANEVEPIFITQERVMNHLNGTCSCDVNRCDQCGGRKLNGIARHKPTCPLENK